MNTLLPSNLMQPMAPSGKGGMGHGPAETPGEERLGGAMASHPFWNLLQLQEAGLASPEVLQAALGQEHLAEMMAGLVPAAAAALPQGGNNLPPALALLGPGRDPEAALKAPFAWGDGELALSADKLQWQQQMAESFLEKLGMQAQGEAAPEGPSPVQRLLGPAPLAAAGSAEFASELAALKEATPLHRSAAVEVPFGRPGWDNALGNRVLWMVNQNVQSAELRLNPANLGPLEVRISVEGDQAHVTFSAHHANVREAIEAAVPRLREMLGESGLSLANVDVSQQGFANHRGGAADEQGGGSSASGTLAESEEQHPESGPGAQAILRRGIGLVDYYA